MEQVWMYYYRYHVRYARSFETLIEAMESAEYQEDDGQQSTVAIVDADGTVYEQKACWKWLEEYRKEHPKPEPVYVEEPREYRTFQDEIWEIND